jgi:ADP-ribosylglycohydrolase
VGIWTDDCSMALAMAASLVLNRGNFVPKHIRYMFILWICNGFCNGGREYSIGLGGNIKISIE